MRKLAAVFTLFLCIPAVSSAKVGDVDKRRNVSVAEWQKTYSHVLRMYNGGICTAQYVSPGVIVTAAHCVAGRKLKDDVLVFNSKNHSFLATLVARGNYNGENVANTDWAVLTVEYDFDRTKSGRFFGTSASAFPANTAVDTIGFGGLKVLTNDELKKIRADIVQIMRDGGYYSWYNRGETILAENDVYSSDYATTKREKRSNYLIKELRKKYGDKKYIEIFGDNNQLKIHKGCTLTGTSNWMFDHDCDTWGGNSGGAVVSGNNLVGVHTRGRHSFETKRIKDQGGGVLVSNPSFYKAIEKARSDFAISSKETPTETPPKEAPAKPKPAGSSAVCKSAGDACSSSGSVLAVCKMLNMGSTGSQLRCVATECKDGFYLVKNAKGQSQGWCKAGAEPAGTNE